MMSTKGLDALFRPASVAIVGASNDANKVGGRPLAFLLKAGWRGQIIPVNPTATAIQGVRSFARLEDVPGEIDQAIVAVPAAGVLSTVDKCIERGVRAIQIFSAGFGEGPESEGVQAALYQRSVEAGVRILGPNSLGLFNAVDGYFGTFATALDGAWPRSGGVGVATQSGAFGSYFFGLAQQRGLGFSHFVATGNESDVDVADCIAWMAADPSTSVIVTAMEGCKDGRKLVRALRAANAAGKPVLAMKVGSSDAGARAAATHTGALSGADRVFDAVLRDAGTFRAKSLTELVDAAYLASVGPMPQGNRLMVVTTSGGIGVHAADVADANSLSLPSISENALGIARSISPLADGLNPVDTSAGILGDLSAYARITASVLSNTDVDAVLCFVAHIPRNPIHWSQLREPLLCLRKTYPHKTFAVVGLTDENIVSDLEMNSIPVFADPGAAIAAIAACTPRKMVELAEVAESPIRRQTSLVGPVSERRAKIFLAERGLSFPSDLVVHNEDEAAAAANKIGYPVVLKILSPDISHKTEVGGVKLGLRDEAALRLALQEMHQGISQVMPSARLEGFIVSRQLDGGIEVLVGTNTDPIFGPIVTVGSGGVLAELFDDVCVRLAPVTKADAIEMIRSTRLGQLLQGYRGATALDENALAIQVANVSQVAWQQRDEIQSIDLNPVLVRTDGAFALDALIVTHGERK